MYQIFWATLHVAHLQHYTVVSLWSHWVFLIFIFRRRVIHITPFLQFCIILLSCIFSEVHLTIARKVLC